MKRGNLIREKRQKLNLTQWQLSQMAGITLEELQGYENNRKETMSRKTAEILAEILNVPASVLEQQETTYGDSTGGKEDDLQIPVTILRTGNDPAQRRPTPLEKAREIFNAFEPEPYTEKKPEPSTQMITSSIEESIEKPNETILTYSIRFPQLSEPDARILTERIREQEGKNYYVFARSFFDRPGFKRRRILLREDRELRPKEKQLILVNNTVYFGKTDVMNGIAAIRTEKEEPEDLILFSTDCDCYRVLGTFIEFDREQKSSGKKRKI